ncbi:MAG: hypothetical protein ACYC77_08620 [Coriobacteriia bacterium]
MKRFVTSLVVLALVVGMAGCGSSGGASRPQVGGSGGSSGGASGGAPEGAIATVEDLKATIDSDYADAAWYDDVTDITLETYMGAQVLTFHVAWGMADTDWEAKQAKTTAIQDMLGELEPEIAPNMGLVDADGTFSPLLSSSILGAEPMNTAFALPAAPTDAAGVKAWLDAVYGPGGLVTLGENETWYDSIQSVKMEDVGAGNAVTITTSLTQADKPDWDFLGLAMQATGSPLLANFAIKSSSDSSFVSGVAGAGTPGQTAFYYSAK